MSRRIRSIKPELLEDEPTAGLTDGAWRLHVSLWLLADDHGNTRYSDRYVAANVWQDTSKEVAPLIAELVTKRFVEPYARSGQAYAHIRGWAQHQRIDNAGKPRVPTLDQDDGSLSTWFREFRRFFAKSLGESPRESKILGEPGSSLPDSPLRAIRRPEGSRRDLEGNGTEWDLSRAREEQGSGPRPSHGEAPVADPPESDSGVRRRSLPPSEVRLMVNFWTDAYVKTIETATSITLTPSPQECASFARLVASKHCPDKSKSAEWLVAAAQAFAKAVPVEKRKFWNYLSPAGLEKWFSAGCPNENVRQTGRSSTPDAGYQSPPPLARDYEEPEGGVKPMPPDVWTALGESIGNGGTK